MRFVKLFSHQSTSLQHLTKEKKKVLHEVSISQTILRESWALRDWRDPHPRSRTREIETSKQTILHRPSESWSQVNLRWGYAAHNKLITNIPWNCSTVCINTVVEFCEWELKFPAKTNVFSWCKTYVLFSWYKSSSSENIEWQRYKIFIGTRKVDIRVSNAPVPRFFCHSTTVS